MPKLTPMSATEMVAALKRAGFVPDRQKGSHLTMLHPATRRRAVVPMHPGDLAIGTAHVILREAGISHEEFADLRK